MRWFKDGWNNLAPSTKKASKRVAYAIVISTLLTLAFYPLTAWIFHREFPWFVPEKVFSFIDSILAGIVAFAMVGAATFIFSTRKPEEDVIDERIAYLYSARRDESAKSHAYLKEQVILLGAAVKHSKQHYEFVRYDRERRALKTLTSVVMTIHNMMKKDHYAQVVKLEIAAKEVSDFNDLGSVYLVKTTSSSSSGGWAEPVDVLEGKSVRLTKDQPRYTGQVAFEIPPAGMLRYEYAFSSWGPDDEVFKCGARRFVESYDIVYTNRTECRIEIHPIDPSEYPEARTIPSVVSLAPGETATISIHELPPTEDVVTTVKVC